MDDGALTVHCVLEAQAMLGEGAFWSDLQQCLYWVDIKAQQLHVYSPASGQSSCYEVPEPISAVIPTSRGSLLCMLRNGLYDFNPKQPSVFKLLVQPELELPGNRLNDATIGLDGSVWFGTMDDAENEPSGHFYRLDSDLSWQRFERGICITNGPALNQDGTQLFFTDTLKRQVYRVVNRGCETSFDEAQLFVALSEEEGFPDGMCCDVAGRLWLCHWGSGLLSCYGPQSELLYRVQLPVSNVTKCAFGGENLDQLYITTARKGLSEQELVQQPLAGALFQVDLSGIEGARGYSLPVFQFKHN
ncbi:MAG: D-xylonolactonase [Patiriisocius sp.]|jgi:D-xylonolactonase